MDKRHLTREEKRSIGACGPHKSELLGPEFKEVKIVCVCPKCDKKHVVKMRWSGKGKPRKYCDTCLEYVESFGRSSIHTTYGVRACPSTYIEDTVGG